MSVKIGRGTPPPAKFEKIIKDLFQNQKFNNLDSTKSIVTFSAANINPTQKLSLIYPIGFNPIDVFLINQLDTYDNDDNLISTSINLTSFAKKNDKFIYGFYYEVFAQDRFPIKELVKSHKPINFSPNATFLSLNYTEVYHDVNDTTLILGLSTADPNASYASLQFRRRDEYFYERFLTEGIETPNLPKSELIGLSHNLSHLKCD
jgi:hypothetical protein